MRIEFKLPRYKLSTFSKENNGYLELLKECFGITLTAEERVSTTGEIKLICRPDQFSRFIVLRAQRRMQNAIAELDAKILEDSRIDVPPKPRTIIDATENK